MGKNCRGKKYARRWVGMHTGIERKDKIVEQIVGVRCTLEQFLKQPNERNLERLNMACELYGGIIT